MASLRSTGALVPALLLVGCSAPPESPAPPPLPLHSPGIVMESGLVNVGSFTGRAFSIDGNGDGTYREAMVGADTYDYDIVTRRFHGGPDGFAGLQKMVKRLDGRIAGQAHHCPSPSATDPPHPYYRIRWSWGNEYGEIVFRYDCRDEKGQVESGQGALFDAFNDVEREVQAWAEPMPIAERYPVIGSH